MMYPVYDLISESPELSHAAPSGFRRSEDVSHSQALVFASLEWFVVYLHSSAFRFWEIQSLILPGRLRKSDGQCCVGDCPVFALPADVRFANLCFGSKCATLESLFRVTMVRFYWILA